MITARTVIMAVAITAMVVIMIAVTTATTAQIVIEYMKMRKSWIVK